MLMFFATEKSKMFADSFLVMTLQLRNAALKAGKFQMSV